MNKNNRENGIFELKGSLFTLTVLHLNKLDLNGLSKQLASLVEQTPKFFHHMPLVIDLQRLQKSSEIIDFSTLIAILREYTLIPVGIRGASAQQNEAAIAAGLAILPNTKAEIAEHAPQPTPAPTGSFAKIITQPVRSGQQIYARQSDLIILAPVSPGAELLADGSIHVYSTLRGRALAGVTGNETSRIFCQQLEAELVSIAGHYWVSEDLQNAPVKQNAQIYLDKERLHIGGF